MRSVQLQWLVTLCQSVKYYGQHSNVASLFNNYRVDTEIEKL